LADFDELKTQLQQRKADDLYRQRRLIGSAQGRMLEVDGKALLNFSSNDYLGLANDDRVRQALVDGASRWGAGSGSSHLICGHTEAHHRLEEALAEYTDRPRCLLFASGYAANIGTINALTGRGDYIFEDRLNHASLLDGGLISGARFQRFGHRDTAELGNKLQHAATGGGRRLVVTDGVFSMDGAVCDIATTAAAARQHDAWLMVDDAHGFGVVGKNGRGLVDADDFGTDDVQVLIGTLGKAFGTQGGFVAGSEILIETLIQSARTYIYSTALPAAVAEATLVSLQIAQQEHWRRERLNQHVAHFRSGAKQLGLQLMESATPIQPVLLGDERNALTMSKALEKQGILVSAIRPPTVPKGTSRLRITLTAVHESADIDRLLQAFEQALS
jgi:8-amino-7-oxononanoate synthase